MAGVAAGWLVAPPPDDRRRMIAQAVVLGALAAAPDLDLLWHRHSGETHSLGAAAIAATAAALVRWPMAGDRWRIWLAAFLAWSSHPLLDALSPDTSPPIGVMAFWPFSHAYVQTGFAVFAPIWRNPVTFREVRHDVFAVVREVVILGPLLAVTGWWRMRAR